MASLADPELTRRTAVCMMADSAGRVMAQEFFKTAAPQLELEKLSEVEVLALAESGMDKVAAGIEPTEMEKQAIMSVVKGLQAGAKAGLRGLTRGNAKGMGTAQWLQRGVRSATRGFNVGRGRALQAAGKWKPSGRMGGAAAGGGKQMSMDFGKTSEAEKDASIRTGVAAGKGFIRGVSRTPKPTTPGMFGTGGETGGLVARLKRGLNLGKRTGRMEHAKQTAKARPTYELETSAPLKQKAPAAQPPPAQKAYTPPRGPSTTTGEAGAVGSKPQRQSARVQQQAAATGRPLTAAEAGLGTARPKQPDVTYNPNARHAAPELTPAPTSVPVSKPPPRAAPQQAAPDAPPTRLGADVEAEAARRGLTVKDYLAGMGALGVVGTGGYMLMRGQSRRQAPPPQYGY